MHDVATISLVGLGFALLLAFGFEVINGFHDTANVVATVIYTQTLPGTIAVVWSGLMNFLGVLLSSGASANDRRKCEPRSQFSRRPAQTAQQSLRRCPMQRLSQRRLCPRVRDSRRSNQSLFLNEWFVCGGEACRRSRACLYPKYMRRSAEGPIANTPRARVRPKISIMPGSSLPSQSRKTTASSPAEQRGRPSHAHVQGQAPVLIQHNKRRTSRARAAVASRLPLSSTMRGRTRDRPAPTDIAWTRPGRRCVLARRLPHKDSARHRSVVHWGPGVEMLRISRDRRVRLDLVLAQKFQRRIPTCIGLGALAPFATR
jgi:hypothetical protein